VNLLIFTEKPVAALASKFNCVVQEVTNIHQQKGMNMMKVNKTHVQAFYEKIKVLHYFRFAAEGLIFFLLG